MKVTRHILALDNNNHNTINGHEGYDDGGYHAHQEESKDKQN